MVNETILNLVGNATADAELRVTQNGKSVANFTIASTPRSFDRQANEWKDGDPLFMRCSVWGDFAENVAATVAKGMRLMVSGRLKQRSYQDKEGNNRTAIELEVDEIGPSLRYATAQVTRAQSGSGSTFGGGAPRQQVAEEPWATPGSASADSWSAPGAYGDDTPF